MTQPTETHGAHTRASRGLDTAQVEALHRVHGYNEIPEREEPLWRRLARRLWGPIPWLIEIAAVLSALVQRWEDLSIILVLLVVNVYIDFHQESKALSALRVLKSKLVTKAIALRDGVWTEITARELVPGDVIRLRLGNIVPADAELLDGASLQIDQSALTGESLPVTKTAGDAVYSNSIVRRGEAEARVTAIGSKAYFGKTVSLVAQAERMERSHFQKAVIRIGNYLILLASAMVILIVIVSLARGDPALEILRFSMVLAIASIPVALPAVLSVTMAIGAVRLARHEAVVSRLVSIEEMAGVDILCCDKTGTLTKNEMSLGEIEPFAGASELDILTYAALASRQEDADPLERPIFEAVERVGLKDRIGRFTIQTFVPFDPVRKRTEAVVIGDDGRRLEVMKGAPQAVMNVCGDTDERALIESRVDQLAANGYRTIGVAVRREAGAALRFVGLLPLFDPPRDDSAEMVRAIRSLGVDLKMITGDNIAIARHISSMLGLPGDILSADDIGKPTDDRDDGDDLDGVAGFAQVYPEHKFDIVHQLQRIGHIVGMTGDGVNDAPALRKADAGIAVSGATDAARAAADLILLAPGLSIIAEAIREARQIFGRMVSYSIFRAAETTRVVLFMTLAIVVFNFYPVTPIMIIILALLNDIPIMAIAYDNARIEPRPVRWDMREVLTIGGVLGIAGVIASFTLFFVLQKMGIEPALIQSMIFLKLSVAGHSTIYVARAREKHFWHRPPPSLKFFVPAFGTQLMGSVFACFGIFMESIGWKMTIYIWLYAIAWFIINDYIKVWAYRILLPAPSDDQTPGETQ